MDNLTEQLTSRREASRGRMDAATLDIVDGATAEIAALHISENSLQVGDRAPEFRLPNPQGDLVSLTEMLERGPVVVTFYRGGWCPYCNLQLRAYARAQDEFEALSATVIAISPETPTYAERTSLENEISFPVLSDVGNAVARDFGLVFTMPRELWPLYEQWGIDVVDHNGDDRHELPVPGTFVISTDGIVTWRFVDPDYTKRAEISDVLEALRLN